MRTSIVLSYFLILALMAACQREEETGSTETTFVSDTATQDVLKLAPAATLPDPPAPVAAPVTAPNTAQQQQLQQPVKTAGTQEALNPPHGQPGHRCEIPVGAPLSSAPKKVSQPATTTTPTQPVPVMNTAPSNTPPVNTAPNPSSTVTAPGMNPPHGQPGHRCDIQVGAPLPTE